MKRRNLLHGLSGSSAEWVRFSKIEYYAKKFHFVIVMPEVNRSFYCDTATGMNYYTYVSKELPEIVNRWFRVDTSPENSYIAGESLGGYGAMKFALRNPQSYAGAAALSGVLDFAAFAAEFKTGNGRTMLSASFSRFWDRVVCRRLTMIP